MTARFLRVVSVVAALFLAGPAPAATLYGASSFHVFGDSFSDSGRIYDLSFGRVPASPPYWRGRFSNGPVWAEYVEDAFRSAGLSRSNQAYGGAQAVRNVDAIPDLGWQARAYRDLPSRRKGDAPMAAIAIGGNDVMRAVGRSSVADAGRRAADEVASTTRYLHRRGVQSFLLFNVPDLGRIPKYAAGGNPARAALATRGSDVFNARLDRRIAEMRREGLDVRLFDFAGAFDALFASPAAFGISDVTVPCLRGSRRCSDGEADRKAFFDDIHPTRVIHARVADLVLADLARPVTALGTFATAGAAAPAPVPLPAPAALLLAALAGLAFVARRRSGAA